MATWHFPSSLWPCALRIARGRKTTAQPQPSDSRVRREGFERCTPVGAAHCNLGTANGTHSTFVPHLHIYLRSCTGHRVCAYWPVCKTSGGQKAQACHSKASAPSHLPSGRRAPRLNLASRDSLERGAIITSIPSHRARHLNGHLDVAAHGRLGEWIVLEQLAPLLVRWCPRLPITPFVARLR